MMFGFTHKQLSARGEGADEFKGQNEAGECVTC